MGAQHLPRPDAGVPTPMPSAGEHIGRAGARRGGAVAMLGDRDATGGDDEGDGGGDIQRAVPVAAGAAAIDRAGAARDRNHMAAHHPDSRRQLLGRFAACRQPHQRRADLGRACRAGDDRLEQLFRLRPRRVRRLGRRRASIGWSAVNGFTLPSSSPPDRGNSRNMSWPYSEAMLSGWNCTPWIGSVRWARPMISPSAVSAVMRRFGRQGRFLDDQRMIARGVEGRRQAGEDAGAVMSDRAHLAVHRLRRADYAAAEFLADRLMAEAHTPAAVPAVLRRAGSA